MESNPVHGCVFIRRKCPLKSQNLEYKSIIHCKEFNVHGRIRRDNFTEMLLLVSVFVIRTMNRQLIERDKVVCK